jgi:hypothetical protein
MQFSSVSDLLDELAHNAEASEPGGVGGEDVSAAEVTFVLHVANVDSGRSPSKFGTIKRSGLPKAITVWEDLRADQKKACPLRTATRGASRQCSACAWPYGFRC